MDLLRKVEIPDTSEFLESGRNYLEFLPKDGMILRKLYINSLEIRTLFLSFTEQQLLYRYTPDKWTMKEILVHLADDERIYAYRALRFARNDQAMLPGFDQDIYAVHSEANLRTVTDIVEEYETVRMATLSLFANLPDSAFTRCGSADGSFATVRALLYHIAAHEMHHLSIIKEKYIH